MIEVNNIDLPSVESKKSIKRSTDAKLYSKNGNSLEKMIEENRKLVAKTLDEKRIPSNTIVQNIYLTN